MRKEREVAALVFTAVVAVLILLGIFYFDLPKQDIGEVGPEDHHIKEQAPGEVQQKPPSSVGDIEDP